MPPRSTRRSWSASPPRRSTCTSTGTRRRSTSAPSTPRPPPPRSTACSARRPARQTRARSPPVLGRAHRPGRCQGRPGHPVPRPGRGRAAGRRDRGGQHHGHLGARTPLRDRAAPALGATRGQIRAQFLAEAILLSLAGGAAGVTAGAAATAVYAHAKGWATVIPPQAWAGGLAAAIVIGAPAGLLPAIRAARLSPTQA